MTEQQNDQQLEKQLLIKAKNGDEIAFANLVNSALEKAQMTLRKSYNYVNEEDLKDASQLALIKAWEKLPEFRGDSTFSTWFYTILKNELLNLFKTKNNINKFEIPVEQVNNQFVESESGDYQNI